MPLTLPRRDLGKTHAPRPRRERHEPVRYLSMRANLMSSQTEINLDSGLLEQIPGLPEPGKKPLFNAENLTITNDGRLFVTGSLAVYEIVRDGDKGYRQQEIPIVAPDVPRNCFMNGITAQGGSLYLACSHIHKGEDSLFPSLFGDVRQIEQNWLGFLLLIFAQSIYKVDSYILRASLENQNPQFTDGIKLPGKCFANGLDGDGKGNLYVANSLASFIKNPSFFKASLSSNGEIARIEPLVFSSPNQDTPNGLKVRGEYVYYTCLHWLPVMTASLKRVKIDGKDGGAGKAEVVYQSLFSIFDDFDITDNGFVIANIMNIPDRGAGSLQFVTNEGNLKGIFRNKGLNSPSSVKVVKKNSPYLDFLKGGDLVITEKGRHCASRFRPNEEWRRWLVESPT